MRIILTLLLALALSLPAVAVAGSHSSSSSNATAARAAGASQSRANKQNKKNKKKKVKGTLTSLDPATVGAVSCVVPTGKTITGIVVGDTVEMTCALVNGVWTLRRLKLDDDAPELEVKGAIQALSPLTVSGISCVVPAGVSLGSLAVGDIVEMKCRQVNGVWTVSRVKQEDRADDNDQNGSGKAGNDDDDNSGSGRGGDDSDGDRSGGGGGGRGGDDD